MSESSETVSHRHDYLVAAYGWCSECIEKPPMVRLEDCQGECDECYVHGEACAEPTQTEGFVNRGRCETCGWPHHRRKVTRRSRGLLRRRRPHVVLFDVCCNCLRATVVWDSWDYEHNDGADQ